MTWPAGTTAAVSTSAGPGPSKASGGSTVSQPANPRVQAVDFAIKLAMLNESTGPRNKTVEQLISDATVIYDFLKQKP